MIGMLLHGYCDGYFDKRHRTRRVEAIGYDWVVVRGLEETDAPEFDTFDNNVQMLVLLQKWSQKEEESSEEIAKRC